MNCSQLYLGTDRQIPLIESELFSVYQQPLGAEEGRKLKAVLGSKYVYYVAPHTGCGCGWDFLDVGTPHDEMSRQSCERLGAFLGTLEADGIDVKVYSVCIESLGLAPKQERSLSLAEFMAHISEYRVGFASSDARVFRLGK